MLKVSAISPAIWIFCFLGVFLIMAVNWWSLREENKNMKICLKESNDKNQKYRDNIRTLEESKAWMMQEINARDKRTKELVTRKGKIKNKIAGYEKEIEKLMFEKETIKHDIEQKQLKEKEFQKKLGELKDYLEISTDEQEAQVKNLEKNNNQDINIIHMRDILRYNMNKVKELLSQLPTSI